MTQTPIKILHVIAGGEVGGAENIFLESALALQELPEVEQAVVTRPVPFRVQSLKEAGIAVTTARFSSWWRFPTAKAVKQTAATFQPDVIHYWMGRAGQYAIETKAVNAAWYGSYYNRKKRFSKCQHHFVMTEDLRRHVRESGVTDEHIHLYRSYAEFPEKITAQPRAELNTPEGAPLLLALARLHPVKGLDLLLDALKELPDCYAWIAGDGPLEDELKAQAEANGVMDRVRFLGWRNDRERLLAAADICVFPSRQEAFGTVSVDAWAMKTPLIAAAAVGPASVVKDRENGLLVPINDVPALTAAIREMVNSPELRDHCVKGGWQTYQDCFTKQAFQRDALAIYRNVLSVA